MANNGPYYQDRARYRVRVTDQAMGRSQNKGTPEFILKFRVLERLIGSDQVEECEQYPRTSHHYITEKTAERFARDLKNNGFDRESFRHLDPSVPGHFSFVGRELEMYCRHDDQNYEKWDFAMQGGGNKPIEVKKPMDPNGLRQLDALFGKHLKNGGGVPAPRPQAVPQTSESFGGAAYDDDVPFMRYEVPCL